MTTPDTMRRWAWPDRPMPKGANPPRCFRFGYAARSASTNSSTPSITMVGGVCPVPSGRASSVSDRTRDRLPPRTARRHPSPVLYFATQYVTMAMPNVAVRTSVYPGSVTCGPVACTTQR
jgi:hypothetical protein